MDIGIPRGKDNELKHSKVKSRAIDVEINILWRNSIEEETKNKREASNMYEDDRIKINGYQDITNHFIFDVNLGKRA